MNVGDKVKSVGDKQQQTGVIIKKGDAIAGYLVEWGDKRKCWKKGNELELVTSNNNISSIGSSSNNSNNIVNSNSKSSNKLLEMSTGTKSSGEQQRSFGGVKIPQPTQQQNGSAGKYSTLPGRVVIPPQLVNNDTSAPKPVTGNGTFSKTRTDSVTSTNPSPGTQPPRRMPIPDFGQPTVNTNNNIAKPPSQQGRQLPTTPQTPPATSNVAPQPKPVAVAPPVQQPSKPAPPTLVRQQSQPSMTKPPQQPAPTPVVVQQPTPVVVQQQPKPPQSPPTPVVAQSPETTTPAPATSVSNSKDMWHINFDELAFEDVIGAGKYGEVSKGTFLHTPVAIKRILECNEETNQMIDRELQMLKEVRHPNIVQFLGATSHNGEIYIITEFMEGGDLFDALIFGDGDMTWKQKLGIAIDIAQACTYLQARGVLHRDLKSQNVLLSSNLKAKLCDLGLARVFEEQANKRLTMVGSDRWCAPEILMGFNYDHKADVFSFGVVLVEIITGSVPDERKPMKRFAFETEAFLAKVPDDCPPEFSKLATQCCSSNPKERPTFIKILEVVKKIYEEIPDEDDQ